MEKLGLNKREGAELVTKRKDSRAARRGKQLIWRQASLLSLENL